MHNLHVVMSQTDYVICLNGHVCCSGIPSSVIKDQEYIKICGSNIDTTLSLYKHNHDHHHLPDGSIDKADKNK